MPAASGTGARGGSPLSLNGTARYVALAVSDWSPRDARLIALTITPPSAPA
jgi:hypothetical protein